MSAAICSCLQQWRLKEANLTIHTHCLAYVFQQYFASKVFRTNWLQYWLPWGYEVKSAIQ